MTQAQFRNCLRILYSIYSWELPDLTKDQKEMFIHGQALYFLRARTDQQDAIWREIEKRQGG